MEGLADEDRVDRVVGERDRVRAARSRLGLRDDALQHRPHAVERLDRDHPREPADELPRQLSSAGCQVEHDRVRGKLESVERRLGIAGPATLVRLGRALEAAREVGQTPARRKARLSRSISRAITRRCTSCVPS